MNTFLFSVLLPAVVLLNNFGANASDKDLARPLTLGSVGIIKALKNNAGQRNCPGPNCRGGRPGRNRPPGSGSPNPAQPSQGSPNPAPPSQGSPNPAPPSQGSSNSRPPNPGVPNSGAPNSGAQTAGAPNPGVPNSAPPPPPPTMPPVPPVPSAPTIPAAGAGQNPVKIMTMAPDSELL